VKERPFRKWQVAGRFHHKGEILVGPRGLPAGALPKKTGAPRGVMGDSTAGTGPQGYFVVTPFEITEEDATSKWTRTVMVNRGWVPKEFLDKSTSTEGLWSRPHGIVEISAIPTKVEGRLYVVWHGVPARVGSCDACMRHCLIFPLSISCCIISYLSGWLPNTPLFLMTVPRWIKPQPDFSSRPLRLLFFDGETFKVLLEQLRALDDNNNNTITTQHNVKQLVDDSLILLTQIKDTAHQKDAKLSFPLQSPADQVGEYKVSPLIHAGYATTWFALSASGLYMTRMLLTRGRG
jgi:surfeit locus 1 family protein